MADSTGKIDKEFILSDSSVNCYGFRLLTSGYQLPEFQKNPIGYYMHLRDDGVVVRWDDLAIKGDNIVGTPVINLANLRGEQTVNEIAGGFLNAASVGSIVVIEYSNEPGMMLQGQTGPTITKWYNKECSLVDIPGNSNALTNLVDVKGNAIALCDMKGKDKSKIVLAKSDDASSGEFPQELFMTYAESVKGGMASARKKDYTLYAVLVDWHYKGDSLKSEEKSRIDIKRYNAYTGELKRRRVEELEAMTPDELFHNDGFEELKKLDKKAFDKKMAEYNKR